MLLTPAPFGAALSLKPKDPVLNTPLNQRLHTPTDKRGLVTSKFWGVVRLRCPRMVSGGMGRTARPPARLVPCVQHPAHLLPLSRRTVVFLIQPGIQAMPHVTRAQAAPTTTPAPGHPKHQHARQLFTDAMKCAALGRLQKLKG